MYKINFLIIYKNSNEAAFKLGQTIEKCFRKRNISCLLKEAGESLVIPDVGRIIVLGGDGTILGVARKLNGRKIPIFGINFGTVGYLCATEISDWENAVFKVITGKLEPKKFITLEWQHYRTHNNEPELLDKGLAINDIVISRGILARVVNLRLSVYENCEKELLRGDGIICYSPLGSTAYNLSAGGPVLDSGLEVMGITPICPFLNRIPPMIVNHDNKIEIIFCSKSGVMTIDGQYGRKLKNNDKICIAPLPDSLYLYLEDNIFYKRLASARHDNKATVKL